MGFIADLFKFIEISLLLVFKGFVIEKTTVVSDKIWQYAGRYQHVTKCFR